MLLTITTMDSNKGDLNSIIRENESADPTVNNTWSMLLSCDSYIKSQNKAAELFKAGVFQLTLARKNSTVSIHDIRFEVDPTTLLEEIRECSSDKEKGIDSVVANSSFELIDLCAVTKDTVRDTNDTSQLNPLFLFNGMPPPALKKAQKEFLKLIEVVLAMQKDAATIQKWVSSNSTVADGDSPSVDDTEYCVEKQKELADYLN